MFNYKNNQPKINASRIEIAVANLVGYRNHIIIPNVSWGLGLNHECDLLILDSKNRFSEVEIKISLPDLKADFKKRHCHKSKIISRLIYAVPDFLKEIALELIPPKTGLISIKWYNNKYKAEWIVMCCHDKTKENPSDEIIKKFMALGCMRIWSLKEKLNNKN